MGLPSCRDLHEGRREGPAGFWDGRLRIRPRRVDRTRFTRGPHDPGKLVKRPRLKVQPAEDPHALSSHLGMPGRARHADVNDPGPFPGYAGLEPEECQPDCHGLPLFCQRSTTGGTTTTATGRANRVDKTRAMFHAGDMSIIF